MISICAYIAEFTVKCLWQTINYHIANHKNQAINVKQSVLLQLKCAAAGNEGNLGRLTNGQM